MKYILTVLLSLLISFSALSQERVLSENAPEDNPISIDKNDQMKAFFIALEPYTKQALESYPGARMKFMKGLPKGESFFLTTRLKDNFGQIEQVFVLVKSISDNVVSGVIFNDIQIVSGFRNGQRYSFPENEIIDWLITKPDGTEEGNFVGKYIDSIQGK